jgi:hypothetical protein
VKQSAEIAAREIAAARYPDAATVFLCGSIVRGEQTEFSDLDLVVVYDHVSQALRESFMHDSWPVEAFIHDPETMEYFFREVDAPTGVPSLADMVSGGIALPLETEFSKSMRASARTTLDDGPPEWSAEEFANSRYFITDLVEDIRSPRSRSELTGTLTRLYPTAATHFFRSRGLWSAKGKSIPRRLREVDVEVADEFVSAFQGAFEDGAIEPVIKLCERLLAPSGGWLFSGHRLEAPKNWRRAR